MTSVDHQPLPQPSSEELTRLRRCLNDLVSVTGLAAVWSGRDPTQVADMLLDAMFGMLGLAFALVVLDDDHNGVPLEVMRAGGPLLHLRRPQDLCEELGVPTDASSRHRWLPEPSLRIDGTEFRLASARLGLEGAIGMLVVGSHKPNFPDQTEALLIQLAANQAAIAIQQTRLTQARVMEATLRETAREAQLIIDTIPALAWTARADGTAESFNKSYLDFVGFAADAAMGWGWTAAVHPEDADDLAAVWRRIVGSGQPGAAEARLRRFDGEYRWFLMRASPFRDESGAIVRWYGVNTDIQDWKQTQAELRRSEQEARLIVDCIPVQIAVLGPAGNVQLVNRPMAEFFGKSVDELDNWKTSDIVPADELPRVKAAMAESFATGRPFEMENRLLRFDGAYRWTQVRGFPLKDARGEIVHWYFSLVDLEKRKQAEEALRRSEGFLAEAQRISSTGSFAWRLDTGELVFSDELYRIFEFDPGTLITSGRIRTRVHRDDLPLLSKMTEQIRAAGGYIEFELRLQVPAGGIKYVRIFGHVVQHTDARRECVGALQDVTQRRLADEALEKAKAELAHVARSISLGALTASIAHEVNQPLSGIVTNAGTCVRMLTADPPNIDGAIETARRTIRDGNRAAEVIARLRTLFSNRPGAIEAVDLNDAAREVIALLSGDLQRNRVVLRTELDGDTAIVTGDRVQLQQVILNLVRNASDAMREVDERPRHLLVKTERDGADRVRLIVQDSGSGIDPRSLDRLFDPFYTTKRDGMGIGLSVSRSIIEKHQGQLWAAPNSGSGATFAFSIPCSSAP